jgi:hypothetical protein
MLARGCARRGLAAAAAQASHKRPCRRCRRECRHHAGGGRGLFEPDPLLHGRPIRTDLHRAASSTPEITRRGARDVPRGDLAMDASLQYRLVTKNYGRSLTRVAQEKAVKKDTDYFWKNIGKVTDVDDFLKDSRLYNYAMKAYGLEDMAYAKGFMKKVLTEGVADRKSFANKLVDDRYRIFAKDFDFQGLAAQTKAIAEDFAEKAPLIESYEQVLADPKALTVMTTALGIQTPASDYVAGADAAADRALIGRLQAKFPIEKLGNAAEVRVLTQKYETAASFGTTVDDAARQKVVTQYLQQTLETEVGEENSGTRLALYFARKGKEITSYYDVLADPALLEVVQTALGLPESSSAAPLETQIRAFSAKFDVRNFSDPAKLQKFVQRFTAVWDATRSDVSSSSAALTLLSGG